MKKQSWKKVASRNILYEEISYHELSEWINNNVPDKTPKKNIKIEFNIHEYHNDYDVFEVEAEMCLMILEKKKVNLKC